MKGVKIIFTLVLSVVFYAAQAQTFERNVISSQGDYITSSSISLEFTLGESFIGHFETSSVLLSQGFNQSDTASNPISVKNLKGVPIFTLYPNPATNKLTIKSAKPTSISVVDAAGKLVKENIHGQGEVNIDVSDLAAGVYLVKVNIGNQVVTQRWVKK